MNPTNRTRRVGRVNAADAADMSEELASADQQVLWGEAEPAPAPMPMPKGFSQQPLSGTSSIIRHTRTGMGCMNLFLGGWITFWTFGCVILLHQYFNGGKMEDGDPIPFWFVAVFWGADLLVGWFFVYMVFAKVSYRLDLDALVKETDVLGLRWKKEIPKASIRRLVQIKDGGGRDDSFPSWGLQVEAEKTTTLLSRQPYAASYWLGQTLAVWAGVEFKACEEKN